MPCLLDCGLQHTKPHLTIRLRRLTKDCLEVPVKIAPKARKRECFPQAFYCCPSEIDIIHTICITSKYI
ncbi:hypothetical protein A0H81_04199 [Grifola frondosa]|uniref:Uncharacterized protein n=1 Tax=Grifola frondosa TaxID=5627 RepID=A0A1C7ME52_GRIFR|nr:hypothetical protein A0H81_04199 [Grifola frondosa]